MIPSIGLAFKLMDCVGRQGAFKPVSLITYRPITLTGMGGVGGTSCESARCRRASQRGELNRGRGSHRVSGSKHEASLLLVCGFPL